MWNCSVKHSFVYVIDYHCVHRVLYINWKPISLKVWCLILLWKSRGKFTVDIYPKKLCNLRINRHLVETFICRHGLKFAFCPSATLSNSNRSLFSTYGIPGLYFDMFKNEVLHLTTHMSPDVLIFDIGSNDLCSPGANICRVCNKLCPGSFARLLHYDHGVRRIIINTVLQRDLSRYRSYSYILPHDYNNVVERYNFLLTSSLNSSDDFLFMWDHKEYQKSTWRYYLANDGVHVSPQVIHKYFSSIRGGTLFSQSH